ncbi:MAG TPA: crotonase/enoyl-CoA hydratase family protein [Acidimicrobiales bacterium]|nr:crotonase/enoyl-CoA hydratase family protein [Acidimicrobiales bacterium]
MTFTQISYEVDGPVATITLDRPDRLNAFTVQMMSELLEAFDRSDGDDRVRAVILTGRGRGFCAGADLGAGGSTFDHGDARPGRRAPRDGGGLVTLRMFRSKKPLIAAVNGPAVGVGASMILPADFRLMAETARIGFVFAARGIVPESASSWFLPRIVGINQALEWCLTARVFPASEALAAGLVRSVHPADGLMAAARAIAEEIAGHAAPVSAAITRQMLWRMLTVDHPMEAHRVDSLAVAQTGKMADAREGVESFLEKRPPRWVLGPGRDEPDWYPWWSEPGYDD